MVSNLANFCAFVDLSGADGPVHITQSAWSWVNHPSEVLHIGQEVEVQVLSIDKEKKKIALSIKRAAVDPWTTVEQRYTPGQVVVDVVTRITPFGTFARVEDGIEGLIHQSELPSGADSKSVLHEGTQLQLSILRIDAECRRLGLSLRQAGEMDPPKETMPKAESEMVAALYEQFTLSQEATSSEKSKRGQTEHECKNPLLSGLSDGDKGELTAMAEAFHAAARQCSKEDAEDSKE